MHPVKLRLLALKKRQSWLLGVLAQRENRIAKSTLSEVLSGKHSCSWALAKEICAAVGGVTAIEVMEWHACQDASHGAAAA